MRPIHFLLAFAIVALSLHAATADHHDHDEQSEKTEHRVHIVTEEDLTLTAVISGRLKAHTTHRAWLLPEAYTGPFHIAEVAKRSGAINAGDLILRIDTTHIDEAVESAERQLTDAQRRLKAAREEFAVLHEKHITQLKQHEIALQRAQSELDVWNSYRGPAMLLNAELNVRSMENFVSNQREELEQLEAMYEDAELDSETKEIVLDRARRSLAIALERLALTKNEQHIVTQFTHPQRAEDVQNEVQYRTEALAHLRINAEIALARKQAEVDSLEYSISETKTRLTRLQSDRERLVVRAPANGLMSRIDVEPGESVNARQAIAKIHDVSQLIVPVELTAADLRIMREGRTIELHVPEFAELSFRGRVGEIATIGRANGDETVFDTEIHVLDAHPLLRLGLRVIGRSEETLKDVLAIPREAVTDRDGRYFVTVDTHGDHVEREITIGAGNDEIVQVVSGVRASDRIVVPAE